MVREKIDPRLIREWRDVLAKLARTLRSLEKIVQKQKDNELKSCLLFSGVSRGRGEGKKNSRNYRNFNCPRAFNRV
jgi:hypothetical protein